MGIGAGAGAAIAGGLGAAGSLAGGAIGSGAAGNAAKAQQFASQMSAMIQAQMYQNTAQLLSPFTAQGSQAVQTLNNILEQGGAPLTQFGLPGTLAYQTPGNIQSILDKPNFNPTQAELEQTPGYQFALTQGLQGVANSNAAQGKGISGDALKGAASFAHGLADQDLQLNAGIFNQNYSNALSAQRQGQGIFQSNLQNLLGPLYNLSTLGENAGAMTGSAGTQTGAGIGQALQAGGNAAASGIIGGANALTAGLTGAANTAGNTFLLTQLLNSGGGGGGGFGNLFGGNSLSAPFGNQAFDV